MAAPSLNFYYILVERHGLKLCTYIGFIKSCVTPLQLWTNTCEADWSIFSILKNSSHLEFSPWVKFQLRVVILLFFSIILSPRPAGATTTAVIPLSPGPSTLPMFMIDFDDLAQTVTTRSRLSPDNRNQLETRSNLGIKAIESLNIICERCWASQLHVHLGSCPQLFGSKT